MPKSRAASHFDGSSELPRISKSSRGVGSPSPYVFVIPLKPRSKPMDLTTLPNYPSFLKSEYATRYLSALGVSATASNVAEVLKRMPLEKCKVGTVWRKDGSLLDAVVVNPTGEIDGGVVRSVSGASGGIDVSSNSSDEINRRDNGKKGGSIKNKSSSGSNAGYVEPKAKERVKKEDQGATSSDSRVLAETRISREVSNDHQEVSMSAKSKLGSQVYYNKNQRVIIVRQMILGLCKPLDLDADEVQRAQELFCKKFPWDEMMSGGGAALDDAKHGKPAAAHAKGRRWEGSRGRSLSVADAPTAFERNKGDASAKMKKYLMSPQVIYMIDCCCHYLYWGIVHRYALVHPQMAEVLRRARGNNGSGIIADVTECDELAGEGGVLLKDGDDYTALMGVTGIRELRLSGLESKDMEKVWLKLTNSFTKIKSEAIAKMGKKATTTYLPLLILSARAAADNLFSGRYVWMSSKPDLYLGKEVESLVGSPRDVWCLVHDEITKMFDPEMYYSHVAGVRENGEGVRGASAKTGKYRPSKNGIESNENERYGTFRRSNERAYTCEGVARGRRNYYQTSRVLESVIRKPSSAMARNMRGAKGGPKLESDGGSDNDNTESPVLHLDPSARASVLRTVMMEKEQTNWSPKKTNKDRTAFIKDAYR